MDLRRLSNGLGAEVIGIDLAPFRDGEIDAIRGAWRDHLVLLFRDQQLTPEAHIAFSRHFGELDRHEALPRDR